MAGITIEELEKATRNVERISVFIGERRDWIVGDGGESHAVTIQNHTRALAKLLVDLTGVEPDPEFKIKLPKKLTSSTKISAARLAKFSDFLGQLHSWFTSQDEAQMPEDCEAAVQQFHGSLAQVNAAVESLLMPTVADEPLPLKPEDLLGEIDDSPVLEVDPNARLMLENSELKPLLQSSKGVMELSPEAKSKFGDFLATQNVSFDGPELRRLHDRLLKWIEGIPLNQVLVIKLSGLSGKANVYASYQSKSDAGAQRKGDD
jgi:hypothetical protein